MRRPSFATTDPARTLTTAPPRTWSDSSRSSPAAPREAEEARRRAAEQSLAAYVAARARAAGFDEEMVALVVACLPGRLPESTFLITTRRIEIELVGPVQLVVRRPL
jgi:hypothetical protein